MKEQTIAKMVKAGVGQDRAEKFWALFVTALCGGTEPDKGDTFTREDIADAFANNVPARNALTAALCDAIAAPAKGRKFKAEKARTYTAAELVSLIVADPKTEGLRAEYMRRTGGADALFYVNGKLAETETAERIQRLFDRDPVAPFVTIGGNRVEPVGYPEPDAKEDAEDPYQRGVALGQPDDISLRLGVSLKGIASETRQAIACAVAYDLSDASKSALQADARGAKGKTPTEYLSQHPIAELKWATYRKPSLMVARTQRNPSPAGDEADAAGLSPRREEDDPRLATTAALRAKFAPAMPSSSALHAAIIDCGLAYSRNGLMAGIARPFVASLTQLQSASAQVMTDIGAMANVELRDGSRPLLTYLKNARRLATGRPEEQVFADAVAALGGNGPEWLDAPMFPFTDPDALRWLHEAIRAYPHVGRARQVCQSVGVDVTAIDWRQAAGRAWHDVVCVAAGQGKMRALFDRALADDSVTAFRDWR